MCIAKISIFAMLVFFAMIAKITVHSENCLLLFLIQTTPFLVFLLSTLTVILLFHIVL